MAFKNNFWPVITERLNELIETNTCKTKIYVFVQPLRTKCKAIVNNSTKSVILLSYTDVKDKFHRIFSKKNKQTKQSCSKSCSQFHIPQTNPYVTFRMNS